MKKIEEFKAFVKTKPELISYVKSGKMSWQQFYELWFLYGSDHLEWQKYGKAVEDGATKLTTFGLTDIINSLKKVDMNTVREGINGLQKAIGLVQDFTKKGDVTDKIDVKEPYKPRPIYRRFED